MLSAGILLWRQGSTGPEVLIAHMGGPFWARKDAGAWSVPKGVVEAGEEPWEAACREWTEELGLPAPAGEPVDLGEVTQRGGKVVRAWAVEGDLDPDDVTPGTFDLEWPPRSGRVQQFPEVDRVEWTDLAAARPRLVTAQRDLLDRLAAHLGSSRP